MAKSLILFYSNTGYNRKVSTLITKTIDSDLIEIKPVKKYSTDMWAAWDVAKKERGTNQLPELISAYPDMSQYDRIFLGGPSWGLHYLTQFKASFKKQILLAERFIPGLLSMIMTRSTFRT